MKRGFLLCLLTLLLCLSACSSGEGGNSNVFEENGYTVDLENQTITHGEDVYTFTVSGGSSSSIRITYPNGATYFWEWSGNGGHGGWSDDYDPVRYADGDFLLDLINFRPEPEPSGISPLLLILLLAVVQPLLRVRWEELTWRYETYQREMDRQTEAYQAAYANSLSGDIADRTAAYISEKAASLGIDCRVQVEVRTEDGLPLPYGASLDVERDQVLSDYMAQELGIPASRQSWQPEE